MITAHYSHAICATCRANRFDCECERRQVAIAYRVTVWDELLTPGQLMCWLRVDGDIEALGDAQYFGKRRNDGTFQILLHGECWEYQTRADFFDALVSLAPVNAWRTSALFTENELADLRNLYKIHDVTGEAA